MPRKPTPTESALFRQAVIELDPPYSTENTNPITNKTALDSDSDSDSDSDLYLNPMVHQFVPNDYLELVNPEAYLEFHRNLSHKLLSKLRRGEYNSQAFIDLHGHTVEQAAQALEQFFQQCLRQSKSILQIIHGKGRQAILKTQINYWLRNIPTVLAFCSAAPKDGGNGALYVLLKKQKHSQPSTN